MPSLGARYGLLSRPPRLLPTVECVDDPCQTVKLDPFGTSTTRLAKNTTYRVVITTGAEDAAGNALASEFSWSFRTGRR